MAARVTPLPDYLRGGAFIPMQVAGDRDTFRASPLVAAGPGSALELAKMAIAVAAFVWVIRRRRK